MLHLASLLDQPALPMLIVGTIIALLGGGSLVAERRSSVSTAFFLTTAAAATWLLSASLMMLSATEEEALIFARLTYVGVCAIPAAVLQFTLALADRIQRSRRVLWGLWLASALFAAGFAGSDLLIRGVTEHPWGYYVDLKPASFSFLLYFGAALAASLMVLVSALGDEASAQQRNRIASFIAALIVGYGGAIDFLPSFGSIAAPSGYIAVLGFVVLSFHALRRYRLVDLSASVVADQLLESLDGGVIVADVRGVVRLANPSAAQLLGYRVEGMVGLNIQSILPSRELPAVETPTITRLGRASRILHVTKNGGSTIELSVSASLLRDRERLPVGILYVLQDLAERRRAEVHEFAAHHDPLTGLGNRTSIMSRFEDVRSDALDHGRAVAVLFIDLDGFKAINDRHGHVIGDRILQHVASRLRNALRSEDLFARWGGDEFVAVITVRRPADAASVSRKLDSVLREPLTLDQLTLTVGASIGAAIAPDDGASLEELVHSADKAMYRIKRGRVVREDRVAPSPTALESRA